MPSDTNEPDLRYVTVGDQYPSDCDTRHEAIGQLAKYGDWQDGAVVPIVASVLGRPYRYPEHLGNKYYGDRGWLATTHGAVRIEREALVRMRNGERQEVVESSWLIDCPICGQTHASDEATEAERGDLVDEVLACCGAEWFPPSDWVADCDVCGDSHRGEFNCRAPGWREPVPDIDNDFACAECGWDGHGEALQGPNGTCPTCDSPAVEVVGT